MFNLFIPWKRQKTKGFPTFLGGMEMVIWPAMGLLGLVLQPEKWLRRNGFPVHFAKYFKYIFAEQFQLTDSW